MCIDGVSHLVMNDETIQALMANPILDLIHKQVVMSLYAMDANHQLSTYKKRSPCTLARIGSHAKQYWKLSKKPVS